MKTIQTALFSFALLAATTQAQTLYLIQGGNHISAYDATTGAAINSPLITGLNSASDIAISGSSLFEVNYVPNGDPSQSYVGAFTTSGAAIQTPLITGLHGASSIAVSGGYLYVVNYYTGVVGKYTTSGGAVNASLINAGAFSISGIGVSGNQLFLGEHGAIAEYDATTGGIITNSFTEPLGVYPYLKVSGNTIYALNSTDGGSALNIGTYNATTGATINRSLVTGLNDTLAIAVYGNDLFVLGSGSSGFSDTHIDKYNAATGAVITQNLVDYGNLSVNAIAVGPQISPVTPTLTSPANASGKFSFNWNAIKNAAYQVQSSTNLVQTNWVNQGSMITASKTNMSSSITNSVEQRFFRIVNQPQP